MYTERMKRTRRRLSALAPRSYIALPWLLFSLASPAVVEARTIDILGTSIEQLMDMSVTTASRREETLSEVPAATYVLTAEDIRRSRATSVPEALRLVPGVQVAKIDNNKWAVSIRGFHSRTANKLLVLIDGRSIYDPLFAGVFWEAEEVAMKNIERIEVIRGPGGTLWGANAVNGVINIITKHTRDTQGTRVSLGAGNVDRGLLEASHGWAPSDRVNTRVYLRSIERGEGHHPDGEADDDATVGRAGFRADVDLADASRLMFKGDAYSGSFGELQSSDGSQDVNQRGQSLTARWQGSQPSGTETMAQIWYSRTELEHIALSEDRDTLDLELQRTHRITDDQTLVWGLAYRVTRDDIDSGALLGVRPSERQDELYSLYVQDSIDFPERRLRLTLGSKLEHNDYTGLEVQPNVRLAWLVDRRTTFWGAVSRAVRMPSRLESDLTSPFLQGNSNFDSEILVAYEAGLRKEVSPTLYVDLSAFYNDYERLRSIEPPTLGNEMFGHSTGIEVASKWQVQQDWRLTLAATILNLHLHLEPGSADAAGAVQLQGSDPQRQLVLRSLHDVRPNLEFEMTARYVSELPALDVPDYLALDIGVGWRLRKNLDLSLAGTNLLDSHHPEQAGASATEVRRAVFAELQWRH